MGPAAQKQRIVKAADLTQTTRLIIDNYRTSIANTAPKSTKSNCFVDKNYNSYNIYKEVAIVLYCLLCRPHATNKIDTNQKVALAMGWCGLYVYYLFQVLV
ncbi:MAG: hypothetical protein BRC25_01590 [Parcubacteria group bacterium SW_6_46_9]|nr:MAG: hypothetical protein BRC25_01590 [Parcubacteria group bacterium SW_6_46_9]